MRRFLILLAAEFNAWRHDPITVAGGFIPPTFILIAFGLLFGGRLTIPIAIINYDEGPYGDRLIETFPEVISPFGTPYYDLHESTEAGAWAAYNRYDIDGLWLIPADFSQRLEAGKEPEIEMYFNNYNDDRAKNHRIYASEILWAFYEKINLPDPPVNLAETYPRDVYVNWISIIAVGVTVLAVTLGGMVNIYALTYKEQSSGLTTEFTLMPRSLAWVLLPKTVLALVMSLFTGTAFLLLLYFWLGVWPGRFLWAVWVLFGLVALFWIVIALIAGLIFRSYMAGAIASVLGAIIIFFISGGLSSIRTNTARVTLIAWLFPNTYIVDPLRDMILFQEWPLDWLRTVGITSGITFFCLLAGWIIASIKIRRPSS